MKISRIDVEDADLLDPDADSWSRVEEHRIALSPAPVALAAGVSPYLAQSRDHGKVDALRARLAHNGATLSIRLSWRDPDRDDNLEDLDRFVDAAAIMFPLAPGAESLTMGAPDKPVNMWLWRADGTEAFDVVAHGFSTSRRRPGRDAGLVARGRHDRGEWTVVFQRPLVAAAEDRAAFTPGIATPIAFAVWEGRNAERAGQKSMSGPFLSAELEA